MTTSNDNLQRRFQELRQQDRQQAPAFDSLCLEQTQSSQPTARSGRWALAVGASALVTGLVLLRPNTAPSPETASPLDKVCAAAITALEESTAPENDVWRTATDDLLAFPPRRRR